MDSLSFETAEKEFRNLANSDCISPETILYLIGNKTDMKEAQKVDSERARQLAESYKAKFI